MARCIGHDLKEKKDVFVNSCMHSVEQAVMDNECTKIGLDRKYFPCNLS